MTEELKRIANEFIAHFKRQEGAYFSKSDLIGIIRTNANVEPLHAGKVNVMLYTLISKGFLAEGEHGNIHITPKGWEYESFDKVLADEKRKHDLEDALLTSSIAASKSTKYVNSLFWVTAIFAFLSAIGTVGTFILELKKQWQTPSPSIAQPLQDTTKTVPIRPKIFSEYSSNKDTP